ncbi:serine hydrolase, partial [Terriglobus sp. ADX1]|uniref:serine hydrolase n=1 Tax=Terriglobus sp. ADX1 TaxID=2794063 RepID=UPI003AC06228
ETYFQEHIFQPLGMTDTSYAVPSNKQSRVAAIHRRTDGQLEDWYATTPSHPRRRLRFLATVDSIPQLRTMEFS